MKIKNLKFKNKIGSTLVETLFYVSLFAITSVVVIDGLVIMTRAFREASIKSEIVESANTFERISREIRNAKNVSVFSSTDIKLDTTDDSGNAKTVEISLSGSDVRLLENDVLTGNLNNPNIAVTSLSFTSISTPVSKAIKILMTVKSKNDSQNRTEDFYDTVVLRGSY